MLANADDLALIMMTEQGKPLAEAKGEITYAASFIEWLAEDGKRAGGDTIPSTSQKNRIILIKEPIGVCGANTPWNFPAAMITRKVGPALAVGCPMVLKPAESTPFSALALAVLAERAGVPAGLFSVGTGPARQIGAAMTSNPIVCKLKFAFVYVKIGSLKQFFQTFQFCHYNFRKKMSAVKIFLGSGHDAKILYKSNGLGGFLEISASCRFAGWGHVGALRSRVLACQSG